jgi:hypothetical protein
MKNGFYNAHNVSSVIEFICQNQNNNVSILSIIIILINLIFKFVLYKNALCI